MAGLIHDSTKNIISPNIFPMNEIDNSTSYRAQTIILKNKIREQTLKINELQSKIKWFENQKILGSDIRIQITDPACVNLDKLLQYFEDFSIYLTGNEVKGSARIIISRIQREFPNSTMVFRITDRIIHMYDWWNDFERFQPELAYRAKKDTVIKRLYLLGYWLFREILQHRDISEFTNSEFYTILYKSFDSTPILMTDWFFHMVNCMRDSRSPEIIHHKKIRSKKDVDCQTEPSELGLSSVNHIPTINVLMLKQLTETIQELNAKCNHVEVTIDFQSK